MGTGAGSEASGPDGYRRRERSERAGWVPAPGAKRAGRMDLSALSPAPCGQTADDQQLASRACPPTRQPTPQTSPPTSTWVGVRPQGPGRVRRMVSLDRAGGGVAGVAGSAGVLRNRGWIPSFIRDRKRRRPVPNIPRPARDGRLRQILPIGQQAPETTPPRAPTTRARATAAQARTEPPHPAR